MLYCGEFVRQALFFQTTSYRIKQLTGSHVERVFSLDPFEADQLYFQQPAQGKCASWCLLSTLTWNTGKNIQYIVFEWKTAVYVEINMRWSLEFSVCLYYVYIMVIIATVGSCFWVIINQPSTYEAPTCSCKPGKQSPVMENDHILCCIGKWFQPSLILLLALLNLIFNTTQSLGKSNILL